MSIASTGRVGAVDLQQQVVLTPRRFGFAAFAEWASAHFTHADAVVLEATSNAWLLITYSRWSQKWSSLTRKQ